MSYLVVVAARFATSWAHYWAQTIGFSRSLSENGEKTMKGDGFLTAQVIDTSALPGLGVTQSLEQSEGLPPLIGRPKKPYDTS